MTEKTLFRKVPSYDTLDSQSERFSDVLLGEADRSCTRGAVAAFNRLIKGSCDEIPADLSDFPYVQLYPKFRSGAHDRSLISKIKV